MYSKALSFQDRELQQAWIRAFAPHLKVHDAADCGFPSILLLEEPAGAACGLRKLRAPTNQHVPFYDWPRMTPHEAGRLLLDAHGAGKWNVIELDLVMKGSETCRCLRQLQQDGWAMEMVHWQTSAYVDLGRTAAAYAQGLSSKLRANTNNAENRLRRQGDLVMEDLAARADWEHWLERAFALEAAGWKGAAGTAVLQAEATRDYYRAVVRHFRAANGLRLFGLRLEERLIAFNLVIACGRTCVGWKTSFDPAFGAFSPGSVLLRHTVGRLREEGSFDKLDMMYPVSEWKQRWSDGTEELLRVTLYARTPVARTLFGVRAAARRLLRGESEPAGAPGG